MCWKEAIRLHCPVPFAGRKLKLHKDGSFQLIRLILHGKDDGRVLEKGAELLIVIDQVHRHPKFHPNPSEFNPEGFATENISKMDTYSYKLIIPIVLYD
jgi:hypothetical protein